MAQCSEECNLLVFQSVNENSVSKLQSAIESYNLNKLLTSLISCNENGETPIVVAIKGKKVLIIEKLVKLFLECSENEYKFSEGRWLIVIENLMQKIPILEWFDFFVTDLHDEKRLRSILHITYFIEKFSSLNRTDHIIFLELVGAIIWIMNFHLEVAGQCWEKALTLRNLPDSNGEPLYPKIPVTHFQSAASNVVFGSEVEVNSMEELDQLRERMERENDPWFLRLQGLLVIRRICMQANAGRPYWLYLQSLLELTRETPDTIHRVYLHLHIMEQSTGFDPHQISTKSSKVFINTLFSLSCMFSGELPENEEVQQVRRELSHPDKLIKITKFINTVVKFFPKPEMLADCYLSSVLSGSRPIRADEEFGKTICFLMLMMETTTQQMTNQEEEELEKYFSYYIQNLFPERTTTPLHEAAQPCLLYDINNSNDIILETVKRMLKLGADPNAINRCGETPLHIQIFEESLPDSIHVFHALVDAGSHLYLANDNGETVMSILRGIVKRDQNDEELPHFFESLVNDVFPLTCLCARVIRRHKIPFLKHQLPLTLHKLVSP